MNAWKIKSRERLTDVVWQWHFLNARGRNKARKVHSVIIVASENILRTLRFRPGWRLETDAVLCVVKRDLPYTLKIVSKNKREFPKLTERMAESLNDRLGVHTPSHCFINLKVNCGGLEMLVRQALPKSPGELQTPQTENRFVDELPSGLQRPATL